MQGGARPRRGRRREGDPAPGGHRIAVVLPSQQPRACATSHCRGQGRRRGAVPSVSLDRLARVVGETPPRCSCTRQSALHSHEVWAGCAERRVPGGGAGLRDWRAPLQTGAHRLCGRPARYASIFGPGPAMRCRALGHCCGAAAVAGRPASGAAAAAAPLGSAPREAAVHYQQWQPTQKFPSLLPVRRRARCG